MECDWLSRNDNKDQTTILIGLLWMNVIMWDYN